MHEETLWSILSDPAHIGAEFISHIIYDLFLGLLLVPMFKRYVKREHNKIDAEHGVKNHNLPAHGHTYKYVYHAGTGRGDDKDTWVCSCGHVAIHKDSIVAHMNYHR